MLAEKGTEEKRAEEQRELSRLKWSWR